MAKVAQARRLGKYFLLIDNLLVVLGFFIVFPLISLNYITGLGWSALIVGFALGLRQLTQQGLGLFGGALADRFGAKPMIIAGMLLRAVGFLVMAFAYNPWLLWASCILSALGGALFDPPRVALVIKLVRAPQRGRFYSLLLMQDSAGAVLGALLGSWLIQFDFKFVCCSGAVIFGLVALLNWKYLPAYRLSSAVNVPLRQGMVTVLKDRSFVTYVLTLTGYYILAVQVMLMLPLMVESVTGEKASVKYMYLIECIISLALLYPIARWSERHFSLVQRLIIGLGIMTFTMIPIGFSQTQSMLFWAIALFYLGTITAEPARETLSAAQANTRVRGSYMGFSRLGLAIGGAIGYTGGGWLFDLAQANAIPYLPWLVLFLIGLFTMMALTIWQRHYFAVATPLSRPSY